MLPRLFLCLLWAAPTAAFAQDRKPHVLILGDSISIGYTQIVQEMMKEDAVVIRPTNAKGGPENCAGTTNGVANLDRWLKLGDGEWDVIHFNFGLHDLKREDPETGRASGNPDHPRQADVQKYERQLREIVKKLKAADAELIFATTTPVPEGKVSPHRDVEDVAKYNTAAKSIMEENGIAVNDLYGFALPKLKEIQRPANVHFFPEGSKALAAEVVDAIRKTLKR